MNNTIKRTTTTVIYKTLVDTTDDATIYHCFVSMLRNENVTKIITQY